MTTNRAICEWTVSGMDCASCASKVRGAVERLPGVSDVDVALMTERLRLTLDEGQTQRDQIEAIIKGLGYGIAAKGSSPDWKRFVLPDGEQASRADGSPDATGLGSDTGSSELESIPTPGSRWYQTAKGRLVIGTGLLLAAAWAVKLLASQDVATWAFVLATLIGVAPITRRAVASARAGMPFTIEMLMTIAASGALVINAAEEAALVVFLFAVGEVLEGVAANKARDGIRALARLVPKTALLEVAGKTRVIPADQLQVDQIVLVRPGDRVPADGEVIEGTSGVDESAVTGESVPNLKEPGQPVFAGSINTEAALRVRVTKAAEDNTIARIIRLVEEAESARAPTERFIDRFSRIYMPAVVGLALMVAIVPPLAFAQAWDTWVYRALALLLIGCPCALVISVPASIASALSAGARRGLLMKGGAVIEAAARPAPGLCHAACRAEIAIFGDRRPHHPARGLRPVDQAPQTDRLAWGKRSTGSFSDPPHLRLGQGRRRHGPDRLSRPRAGARPLHPDDGRQQPRPVATTAGRVTMKNLVGHTRLPDPKARGRAAKPATK